MVSKVISAGVIFPRQGFVLLSAPVIRANRKFISQVRVSRAPNTVLDWRCQNAPVGMDQTGGVTLKYVLCNQR